MSISSTTRPVWPAKWRRPLESSWAAVEQWMKPSVTSESAWYLPARTAWFHCSRVVMWKMGSVVSDHPGRGQLGEPPGVDPDLAEHFQVVLPEPGRVEPTPVAAERH